MATNRIWSVLWNVFDNQTKGSFKRMLIASKDHLDKLKKIVITHPALQSELDFLLPHFIHFQETYTAADSNHLYYQSQTQAVEKMFADLSNYWIKKWDIAIQNHFLEGTVEYTMLLGDRRTPFQSGSYEERVSKIRSLATRLQDFPQLSTIQAEVSQYATDIENARTKQQGLEYKESNYSNNLEAARKALAQAMFGVLGALQRYFWDNLEAVETLYELQYWTSPTRKAKEGSQKIAVDIAANEQVVLAHQVMEGNDTFEIEAKLGAAVAVYGLNSLDEPMPINARIISGGTTEILTILDIASSENGEANFLVCKNLQKNAVSTIYWQELVSILEE